MFKISTFILFLIITLINAESKVLYKYVNRYDPNYKWTLNATHDIGHANVHVLEFTSQRWLSDNETTLSVWKHWLQICIPKTYDGSDSAILAVEGGNNNNWVVPTASGLNKFGNQMLCSAGNQITATLQQSPNQDVIFENDGVLREEDDIVAYSWMKYINTKNSDWVSLNPQTKSAIKAMDAVQEFGKTLTGNYTINKFVVTGGSKRGWTTWGTAMVKDPRVIGIAPMVISVLNLVQNIEVQIQLYGNWSFALQDYMNNNVTQFLYTKYFEKLAKIIDPINYVNVFKSIPKFVILATNDEFFAPDSTKFFLSKLKGETKFKLFSNLNHNGIKTQAVADQIVNFYNLITKNIKFPQYSWSIDYSNDKNTGTITLRVQSGTVSKVELWYANTVSKERRDFRYVVCKQMPQCFQGYHFVSLELQPTSTNTYTYSMSKPTDGGWTGFFMDVHFTTGSIYSSEMAVVPDVLPFAKCSQDECGSGVPDYVKNRKNGDSEDDDDQDDDDQDDDQD